MEEQQYVQQQPEMQRQQPRGGKKVVIVLSVMTALLLVVTGFLAYAYVKDDTSNESTQPDEAQQVVEQQPQPGTAEQAEAGLSTYESTDYGFAFDYPSEWGKATVEDGPETDHLIKGFEKRMSFSQNPNISVGFQSPDREHDPLLGHGGGPFFTISSIDQHLSSAKEYLDESNIYVDSEDKFLYVDYCNEFCSSDVFKTVIYAATDTSSSAIGPVNFVYFTDPVYVQIDKDTGLQNVDSLEGEASTVITNSDYRVVILKKVLESFRAL